MNTFITTMAVILTQQSASIRLIARSPIPPAEMLMSVSSLIRYLIVSFAS